MTPTPLPLGGTRLRSQSIYTLDTLEHDDRSPLFTPATPSYGIANLPSTPSRPSSRKLLLNTALKMAAIFIVSTLLLGGTLWLALPTLEEADRPLLKIPKSFAELKDLNGLLKKYRDIYPYRIVICYVVTYLFLQAFSLPGSMYLSILGGAVWGVPRALPLGCCCVATGATLCYLISAALGPALMTLPKWKRYLDQWAVKIQANKENMIAFLIVLRVMPLPPHWVVNIVCPHVGIGLVPFWLSTWLGVFGVTVIHTTIGSGLDDMTSAADFHLISWRNFFGLAAVVVGVMIPVGLRYWFRKQVESVGEAVQGEEATAVALWDGEEEVGPRRVVKEFSGVAALEGNSDSWSSEDDDDDDDVILEAGPAILDKNDVVGNENIKILDTSSPSGSRRR